MTRWFALARESLRGIWFRASIFTLAGILLAVFAPFLGWAVPKGMSGALGQDSASTILEILAASMLAVTTFSLTTMVSAYATATQIGTPRSIQLLIGDRTSHNALSTFVGAFAFSIVSLVALSLPGSTEGGRTVLFLGTILVIAAVLVTLLRWISFLTTFGRMADIIDRIEVAACDAMQAYADDPLLGGRPWIAPPPGAMPVTCDQSGFVVHVDVAALQRVAEQEDCLIWVERRPGSRVVAAQAIAYLSLPTGERVQAAVQRAFVVAAHRTFDQDPRLGLIALSEISSRALSPAVNDPGTGIEVLGAQQRVLELALRTTANPSTNHSRVHVRGIERRDMVEDAFRPIARDGAAIIEVALRIQREISALLTVADEQWTTALRTQAADALRRAEDALTHESDLREVRLMHAEVMTSQRSPEHSTDRQ